VADEESGVLDASGDVDWDTDMVWEREGVGCGDRDCVSTCERDCVNESVGNTDFEGVTRTVDVGDADGRLLDFVASAVADWEWLSDSELEGDSVNVASIVGDATDSVGDRDWDMVGVLPE
jgi:hypothetical protein